MPDVFGKSDLINAVRERADVPRVRNSEVEKIIEALATMVREKAAAGLTVSIPGLGRFNERTRAARTGRNPSTGEPMDIPSSVTLGFKPSKPKA